MHTQPLPYLPLLDFDGTMARTFETSPHNIGVDRACEFALSEIFGEGVVELYRELGGLRNRAPEELIRHLVSHDHGLTSRARQHHQDRLATDADVSPIAELFVEFKLAMLLDEIGEDWPKPCEGFCVFAKAVSEMSLEYGIISSGHHVFIEKTLAIWGLPVPRVLVTDDDVRRRKRPADPSARTKPALLPYQLALRQWNRSNATRNPQTLYIGDDSHKDGGLATNAGVPFGFFTNGNSGNVDLSPFPHGSFRFDDWAELARFMVEHQEDFRQGEPCAEIFRHFGPR